MSAELSPAAQAFRQAVSQGKFPERFSKREAMEMVGSIWLGTKVEETLLATVVRKGLLTEMQQRLLAQGEEPLTRDDLFKPVFANDNSTHDHLHMAIYCNRFADVTQALRLGGDALTMADAVAPRYEGDNLLRVVAYCPQCKMGRPTSERLREIVENLPGPLPRDILRQGGRLQESLLACLLRKDNDAAIPCFEAKAGRLTRADLVQPFAGRAPDDTPLAVLFMYNRFALVRERLAETGEHLAASDLVKVEDGLVCAQALEMAISRGQLPLIHELNRHSHEPLRREHFLLPRRDRVGSLLDDVLRENELPTVQKIVQENGDTPFTLTDVLNGAPGFVQNRGLLAVLRLDELAHSPREVGEFWKSALPADRRFAKLNGAVARFACEVFAAGEVAEHLTNRGLLPNNPRFINNLWAMVPEDKRSPQGNRTYHRLLNRAMSQQLRTAPRDGR